ncbi:MULTISPECIES: DUF2147 domain-containing protein [unclassified Yoonia]|uniref:DUF2147 domain-containing protein n=1 Tax=unclassified Yoonia TaxID=2629118 RepID=UPI002AFE013B|nr:MULTISPECIES: DUF2147 domain-containing protein [unclassified Yoonia]
MKHLILAAAAAFALASAASAQDAALGTWQTEVDDGAFAYVTMDQCGAAVCGTIARTFNTEGEYASPNIGRQIVINMAPNGDGSYQGQVWRPSNDRIYVGKMDVEGNALRLRGCVAGGLICASQNWVRIE